MSFCTVVNCMDGRVQLPVIEYLKKKFNADYVDVVSEAGPNRILGRQTRPVLLEAILYRIEISVSRHESVGIAVVGHHDCAGNPAGKEEQNEDTQAAVAYLREQYKSVPVIGLWVDENWEVSELPS